MDADFTRHATTRARQRGIPDGTIDLLMRFGRRTYTRNGACLVTFDHRARARIERELGREAAQLKLSAYAVLDAERQTVITVGHRTRRIQAG